MAMAEIILFVTRKRPQANVIVGLIPSKWITFSAFVYIYNLGKLFVSLLKVYKENIQTK